MRAKVVGVLAGIAVCFLTFLIVFFNVQINVSTPAQLYADVNNTWLQFSDPYAYNEIKNYSTYTLTDQTTHTSWKMTVNPKAKTTSGMLVSLVDDDNLLLQTGWHPVAVAIKTQSLYNYLFNGR